MALLNIPRELNGIAAVARVFLGSVGYQRVHTRVYIPSSIMIVLE